MCQISLNLYLQALGQAEFSLFRKKHPDAQGLSMSVLVVVQCTHVMSSF